MNATRHIQGIDSSQYTVFMRSFWCYQPGRSLIICFRPVPFDQETSVGPAAALCSGTVAPRGSWGSRGSLQASSSRGRRSVRRRSRSATIDSGRTRWKRRVFNWKRKVLGDFAAEARNLRGFDGFGAH